MKLGAIEAGGTKFVVCIGDEFGKILRHLESDVLDQSIQI